MALMVMRACRPGSADMRQPRRRRAAPAGVRSWFGTRERPRGSRAPRRPACGEGTTQWSVHCASHCASRAAFIGAWSCWKSSFKGQTCAEPRAPRVYGPNEGSAATGAHGREPQNPQSLRAQRRGRTSAPVRCEQKTARGISSDHLPRLARESWRPPSAPRDHRTLRTLRSSTLKNKNPPTTPSATWKTSHQYSTEPGAIFGQDSSQNDRDYLGEFR
jgi:hypothetical protein